LRSSKCFRYDIEGRNVPVYPSMVSPFPIHYPSQHHMLASSFEEMPQVFYDIHTIAVRADRFSAAQGVI
jgi:hypothetical protein